MMKKARHSTPEVVRLRTYKIDTATSAAAPQLQLDQLFSPTMALNHLFLDSPMLEKHNGALSPITPDTPRSTPSPRPHPSPTRQHLNGLDQRASPPPLDVDPSLSPPQSWSHTSTPTNERNPAWSSAVGKATIGGKSGRVIERLMNENDRLLREKKLATVQWEEELKRGDSARSALESLQVANEHLTSMHDADATLLLKRDRRIQELREELRTESVRRENAEANTRNLRSERDETVERIGKQAIEDREQSRRATSQYEALSKSWKGLEDRYERQTRSLKADIKAFQTDVESDREKLERFEVIIEQLYREAERSRKQRDRLWLAFEDYKRTQECGMSTMKDTAALNSKAMDHAQHQMETVLGQMRHIINVKRDVKGAE